MCVAIAVVAGIGVAGSVTAAKISSNASKNAAKTQVAAGDRALALQQEQYAQSRADFNPYKDAGNAALSRLGTQATAPVTSFRPGQPMQLGQTHGMPANAVAMRTGGGPVAPGFQGSPAAGVPPSPLGGPGPSAGVPPSPVGGPGQSVVMQGPDGAQRPVPASAVASLQQRGFQVISGG